MPAEPALDAGPLVHEVLAVIDEQPDVTGGDVQASSRQAGLAQRRSGDSERVDRVGLAGLPHVLAGVGHQPGRDAADRLAGPEQVGLQAPGQVTVVLHRPRASATCWPRASPMRLRSVVAVLVSTSRPRLSTATKVCDRLCASTAITAFSSIGSPSGGSGK